MAFIINTLELFIIHIDNHQRKFKFIEQLQAFSSNNSLRMFNIAKQTTQIVPKTSIYIYIPSEKWPHKSATQANPLKESRVEWVMRSTPIFQVAPESTLNEQRHEITTMRMRVQ